ncbi:putative biofilm-associated protein [Staphylococcus gallinarum]|uniref:Putative biofilm-associated protein n=1 Tax=Staphylococcus gallinarum TaxID=1293 RepID=A0A380FNL3_STAGA|nr:putative biofilm-associated protein [Staphylococcus gallinarum]
MTKAITQSISPSNKKFNGGESIKVTSTDASGNKSGETVIAVKDTTPPVAPTVSEVTSGSTQVTGTGEPGSTVKVELPDWYGIGWSRKMIKAITQSIFQLIRNLMAENK